MKREIGKRRPICDTFAARGIEKSNSKTPSDSFVDYGIRAGYSINAAKARRQEEMYSK